MTKMRLLLFALWCAGALVFAPGVGQAQITKPVVVMIEHNGSAFVYKINSIPVPVDKGLLYTLSFMPGAHSDSILLVDVDAKLSMLIDAYGIMNKAGFVHPKVFYFNRRQGWMAEWTPSTSLPFSEDGQVPSK